MVSESVKIQVYCKIVDRLASVNPSEAIKQGEEGIALCKKRGANLEEAYIMGDMGLAYQNLTNYTKSIYYQIRALKTLERLNADKDIANELNDIGISYASIGNYEKAKEFLLRCLEQNLTHNGEPQSISKAYNNLGNLSFLMGKIDDCTAYYLKAISTIEKNQLRDVTPYLNIADIYSEQNKLDIAESYYKKYYDKSLEYNQNDNYFLINSTACLGALYFKKKQYNKAEAYLLEAENLARSSGIIAPLADIYNALIKIYDAQQEYQAAYNTSTKLINLKDSALQKESLKQINELQVKYETEKKDEKIKLLHKDKEVAETQVEKASLTRNLFILAFVFIVIVAFFLSRNIHLKHKINRILNQKNIELESSNTFIAQQKKQIELINDQLNNYNAELQKENVIAQYQVLKSKTNPHFLFNSLTTLSSLIIKDQLKAIDYVQKFSELYRNILKTDEQRLVSVATELNMVEQYLELQKIRFKQNLIIQIDLKVKDQFVPPFSLQMVVENAIKHNIISEDDALYISIYQDNDYIVVKNNLQKKIATWRSNNIGQKNIIGRYELLSPKRPTFNEYEDHYIAKLPLLNQ
jgi:sensor histidine kinase YesM